MYNHDIIQMGNELRSLIFAINIISNNPSRTLEQFNLLNVIKNDGASWIVNMPKFERKQVYV